MEEWVTGLIEEYGYLGKLLRRFLSEKIGPSNLNACSHDIGPVGTENIAPKTSLSTPYTAFCMNIVSKSLSVQFSRNGPVPLFS